MLCKLRRIEIYRNYSKNSETICHLLIIALLYALLSACTLNTTPIQVENTESESTPIPFDDAVNAFTELWTDENAVMGGICFESAFDAVGQVFVLRDDAQLINFFNLADNSRLCRRAVVRQGFDFSTGRVLAGLWSYGFGCVARHELIDYNKDDTARTLTITLRFITEGTCNYELVRPFWIGISDVVDYEIALIVE